MQRRTFLQSLGAAGLMSSCTLPTGSQRAGVIYAPAPPATPLHALNMQLGEALRLGGVEGLPIEPLALPESVNQASALNDDQRTYTLPIVTTADFLLARNGAGPRWHSYDRASTDLQFCSTLYDVGLGMQVVDPAITKPADLAGRVIAVPPRPSAVRMIGEALIEHGWKIPDITFVDTSPQGAAEMLAEGEVAASGWNPVIPRASAFAPILGRPSDVRFLPVEPSAIADMNSAMGFALGATDLDYGPMISFAQALAVWSDTPDRLVEQILAAIARFGGQFAGLPDDPEAMRDWPELAPGQMHAAARKFFEMEHS